MFEVDDEILAVSLGGTVMMEIVLDPSARDGFTIEPTRNIRDARALLGRMGLSRFQKQYHIRLVTIPVAQLDSNNVHPPLWKKTVEVIIGKYKEKFDKTGRFYKGIFLPTGTDTEEYLLPALAAALGKYLNTLLVGVTAQSVPDQELGDARLVCARSLALIHETDQVGTLAICGNSIFEAARSIKRSEVEYDFLTSDSERGKFVNDAIHIAGNLSITRDPERPPFDERDILTCFSDNVLPIKAIPGFKPSVLIPILPNVNGLMVIPNGAGNLSDLDDYSYLPLLKEAERIDLPVLVPSPFAFGSSDNSHYEAGKIVQDTGCLTNNGLTTGAATAMFYLALGQAEQALADGTIVKGQVREYVKQKMVEDRFALSPTPFITYPTRAIPRPLRRGRQPAA